MRSSSSTLEIIGVCGSYFRAVASRRSGHDRHPSKIQQLECRLETNVRTLPSLQLGNEPGTHARPAGELFSAEAQAPAGILEQRTQTGGEHGFTQKYEIPNGSLGTVCQQPLYVPTR